MEVTSHGLPEAVRPSADRLVSGATAVLQLDDACSAGLPLRYSALLCPPPSRVLNLLAGIGYSGELVRREKACLSDNSWPLLLSKRDEWDVGRSLLPVSSPPCPSLQLWPTTPTCARPPGTLTAIATRVSSALGSLTLRRKPTAATRRLQGASAALWLNLRP